jgi:hypothetical protein
MSDDTPAPDEIDPDAIEALAETAEANQPKDVDSESNTRQDEGWMQFYVECPDCRTPMSPITTESETLSHPSFVHSAEETNRRFACGECGEMTTAFNIRRVTVDTDELQSAYDEVLRLGETLIETVTRAFGDNTDE